MSQHIVISHNSNYYLPMLSVIALTKFLCQLHYSKIFNAF